MPASLNQYLGEIRGFYNRSTSQIKEWAISLFNILVNFTENVLVYIILIVNMIFLRFLHINFHLATSYTYGIL